MAAGDRNKTGKPKDIVRHYIFSGHLPICGEKRFGYATNNKSDIDCKKCLKKLTG